MAQLSNQSGSRLSSVFEARGPVGVVALLFFFGWAVEVALVDVLEAEAEVEAKGLVAFDIVAVILAVGGVFEVTLFWKPAKGLSSSKSAVSLGASLVRNKLASCRRLFPTLPNAR